MKKLIPILLLFSCTKENQQMSDEVLLTVTSECECYVKLFQMDGSQYLSIKYDCQYVHILPLRVASGTYIVKAETPQEQQVNKLFTKGNYSQNLNIEF